MGTDITSAGSPPVSSILASVNGSKKVVQLTSEEIMLLEHNEQMTASVGTCLGPKGKQYLVVITCKGMIIRQRELEIDL